MGVAKQAAQKRFVPKASSAEDLLGDAFQDQLFSRFTSRAKRTVTAAMEEVRKYRHGFIGTEHLALALLDEPEGLAAKAIWALGVAPEAARQALVAAMPPATADEPASGGMPFTPRANKVLKLALREALQLGHNYIGTEHVLLGVLAEEDGIGARTLTGWASPRSTCGNGSSPCLSSWLRPSGRPASSRPFVRGSGRHR